MSSRPAGFPHDGPLPFLPPARETTAVSPRRCRRLPARPARLVPDAPPPPAVAGGAVPLPDGRLGIHAAADPGADRPALLRALDACPARFPGAGRGPGRARPQAL